MFSLNKNKMKMNKTTNLDLYIAQAIHQRLPVVIYIGVVMLVGVIGNLHVLIIFMKIRRKQSTYHVFVYTLAVVDLITCVLHMPLEILDLMVPYTYVVTNGCKLMRFNQMTLLSTSIFILVLIAFERYKRICRPLHSKMTLRTAICLIITSAFAGGLISSPMYVVNGHHAVDLEYNVTGIMCFIQDEYVGSTFLIVSYCALLLIFLMSAAYIIISYLLILSTVKKSINMIKKHDGRPENLLFREHSSQLRRNQKQTNTMFSDWSRDSCTEHNQNRECIKRVKDPGYSMSLKTTKTLLYITFLFFTVFLPFIILGAYVVTHPKFKENMSDIEFTFYQIGFRLILINNIANPFIYSFTDNRFKTKLRAIYSCKTGQ